MEKTLPKVYVAEKWAWKIKSITYPVLCEAFHVTFMEYGNSVFYPVSFNEGSFESFVIILMQSFFLLLYAPTHLPKFFVFKTLCSSYKSVLCCKFKTLQYIAFRENVKPSRLRSNCKVRPKPCWVNCVTTSKDQSTKHPRLTTNRGHWVISKNHRLLSPDSSSKWQFWYF